MILLYKFLERMSIILFVVNSELVIINNWFISNRLSLNLNKSRFIIFNSSKKSVSFDSPLSINNSLLNRVTQIRYLDILILNI